MAQGGTRAAPGTAGLRETPTAGGCVDGSGCVSGSGCVGGVGVSVDSGCVGRSR